MAPKKSARLGQIAFSTWGPWGGLQSVAARLMHCGFFKPTPSYGQDGLKPIKKFSNCLLGLDMLLNQWATEKRSSKAAFLRHFRSKTDKPETAPPRGLYGWMEQVSKM